MFPPGPKKSKAQPLATVSPNIAKTPSHFQSDEQREPPCKAGDVSTSSLLGRADYQHQKQSNKSVTIPVPAQSDWAPSRNVKDTHGFSCPSSSSDVTTGPLVKDTSGHGIMAPNEFSLPTSKRDSHFQQEATDPSLVSPLMFRKHNVKPRSAMGMSPTSPNPPGTHKPRRTVPKEFHLSTSNYGAYRAQRNETNRPAAPAISPLVFPQKVKSTKPLTRPQSPNLTKSKKYLKQPQRAPTEQGAGSAVFKEFRLSSSNYGTYRSRKEQDQPAGAPATTISPLVFPEKVKSTKPLTRPQSPNLTKSKTHLHPRNNNKPRVSSKVFPEKVKSTKALTVPQSPNLHKKKTRFTNSLLNCCNDFEQQGPTTNDAMFSSKTSAAVFPPKVRSTKPLTRPVSPKFSPLRRRCHCRDNAIAM